MPLQNREPHSSDASWPERSATSKTDNKNRTGYLVLREAWRFALRNLRMQLCASFRRLSRVFAEDSCSERENRQLQPRAAERFVFHADVNAAKSNAFRALRSCHSAIDNAQTPIYRSNAM
jgi:hypothetical protein